MGTHVLLKRCAFEAGRHKLADKYHKETFVIVHVNEQGDVYTVRPVLGGRTQTVNRKLLVKDPGGYTLPIPELRVEDGENEIAPEHNDDDVHNSLLPLWLFSQGRPQQQQEVQSQDVRSSLRRSSRVNKGCHSNPAHLPRSVVTPR